MSDINKIKRDRRSVLQAAEQALRPVDTKIEFLQRLLKRLRSRTRSIPTVNEMRLILDASKDIDRAYDDFAKVLKAGWRIFQRVL